MVNFKLIKSYALISLFFFTLQAILPQQKIILSNTIKDKIINTYTGVLLVRTGKGLYGIGPESQSLQWQKETLGKVDFNSYKEIPYSPLVVYEDKPILNSKLLSNTLNAKGTSRIILNVINGKALFDSEKAGFKSVNRTLFVPDHQALLVDGILEKEMAVALYSYRDQKMLWKTNLTDSNFFKNLKGTLFQKEKVLLDKEQNVFWLKNNHLLNIDGRTGQVRHEKGNIESIAINGSKEIIYIFTRAGQVEKLKRATEVMAYSAKEMLPVWDEPVKVLGTIREVAFEGQKLITITSSGFNILDNQGKKQWREMVSLPLIKKIVPVHQGFLVVQEKFLSLIGNDGKKVWPNSIKVSLSNDEAPVYLFESDTSVIYITPSRANKVTISKGEKLWEDVILNDADFISRNLKLSEPTYRIWYDSIAQQYPVYSNNELHVVNGKSKEAPGHLYEFDFGKSLPNLRIGDYGYFMENDNNYFLFDRSGELVYEKNYPSVKRTSFFGATYYYLKRGFGTYRAATNFVYNQVVENVGSTVASGNLGILTNLGSAVYGSYQIYQNPQKVISNLEELGLDSGGLKAVFKRTQKGKEGEGSLLIVEPKEDGTASILRLHIPSGKEEVLKQMDASDSFVIDQIEQMIYRFNGKEIRIERLH
ncbi:MAG: hypothetical protein AAF039_12265 [Bacteroidota bacterium]